MNQIELDERDRISFFTRVCVCVFLPSLMYTCLNSVYYVYRMSQFDDPIKTKEYLQQVIFAKQPNNDTNNQ